MFFCIFCIFCDVGCVGKPITISSIDEIQKIGTDKKYPADGHYVLVDNIDASITSEWNNGKGFDPIIGFNGVFDGNGYSIHGLVINRPDEWNVGLFGNIYSNTFVIFRHKTEIRNLRIERCTIKGRGSVGGLVGRNSNGYIVNCYVHGNIVGHTDETEHKVLGNSNRYIGGLVGFSRGGRIHNCSTSVVVEGRSYVGGLVGYARKRCQILDSHTTGSITGEIAVGGLIGFSGDMTGDQCGIERCYSTASVFGDSCVGGLVGENFANELITQCFSTGRVEGKEHVGGLIGLNTESKISNCYAWSVVRGKSAIGGLLGSNVKGIVENSYSTGRVKGDYYVGGFIGSCQEGLIKASFWDTESSNIDKSTGNATGLPHSAIVNKETFIAAGWDFTEIWTLESGETYPTFLRANMP